MRIGGRSSLCRDQTETMVHQDHTNLKPDIPHARAVTGSTRGAHPRGRDMEHEINDSDRGGTDDQW